METVTGAGHVCRSITLCHIENMADIGDELREVWIMAGAHIVAGGDSETINDWLATKLEKITTEKSGWVTLYRNRESGEFWEMSYPNSEMHGGGPRLLTCLGLAIPDRWLSHT
jgi:hypothetical protein